MRVPAPAACPAKTASAADTADAADPTVAKARTDRIGTAVGELAVRMRGCGTGPATLLWHSMLVAGDQWSRFEAELPADRTVIVVDGPGHGDSGVPPATFTLEACADAAAAVLDHFGIPEVDWVGNAWGGHVGIVFAHRHPARITSLVAIASPLEPLPGAERRQTRMLAIAYGALGAAPVTAPVLDALLSKAGAAADPGAREIVRGGLRRSPRRGLRRAIVSQMVHRPDISALLPAIDVPTLLIAGERDPLWSPAANESAATTLPRGRAATVAGAFRLPPLERPGPTAALVLEFWASLPTESHTTAEGASGAH